MICKIVFITSINKSGKKEIKNYHHFAYFCSMAKNWSRSVEAWPSCVMKGCWSNCFEDQRCPGSFFKQLETKLVSLSENPTTCGGSSLAILYIALKGCSRRYGGSPLHSSITKMPNDQMSTISSYYSFLISSGAIHGAVPASPCALTLSAVSWRA